MSTLKTLLDDLHKLEINTIEKSVMTAQKMPPPLLAIHETIDGYESYLRWHMFGQEFDYKASGEEHIGANLAARLEQVDLWAAERFAQLADDRTTAAQAERMICGRIDRSCEFLRGMLERGSKAREADPKDGDTGRADDKYMAMTADQLRHENPGTVARCWRLSAADLAYLRKIWEIGTEKILVQTVIQIEGDVISRISPLIEQENKAHLLAIHKDGIETSLRMWGSLISFAERLVNTIART